MTSPAKLANLTDTQLVILSAASQRGDRCLIAPSTLKGGAAQKIAATGLQRAPQASSAVTTPGHGTVLNRIAYTAPLFWKAMAAIGAGIVNTRWK